MSKFIDLTGEKFGRLIVVNLDNERSNTRRKYWICNCECGSENISVLGDNLKGGKTTSCGCYSIQIATENLKKYRTKGVNHGMSYTRIYKIWESMKKRCLNKNLVAYKYYGGRGIKVCDEWLDEKNGFLNFYNWSCSNGYTDDLTIDRIDVNGNYEPFNCRWVTMKEQCNNRTSNRLLTIDNITKTTSQWADYKNIDYKTLMARIYRGTPIDKLFD